MKKIISLMLAALMVAATFFTLPFNAFAISQNDVNGAKEVTASSTSYTDENVANSSEQPILYYKITVAETGIYSFYTKQVDSSNAPDTYGTLYDADFNKLAQDDDTDGRNFKITSFLQIGSTYYLAAKCYSDSDFGKTFNIIIERDNDSAALDGVIYTKQEVEDYESDDPDATKTVYYASGNYLSKPTNVTIKSQIDGIPVVAVDENCFERNQYITSLTIEEGVKEIYPYAFGGCNNLTSIKLCDSITALYPYSFAQARAKNIVLPASLVSFEAAFAGASVESFSISSANENFKTENGILYSADKKVLFAYPALKSAAEFSVPDGVTEISEYAFALASIDKIVLPSTVVGVYDYAFDGSKVSSIVLNEGLEEIGAYAFESTKITELNLPSSIKKIGRRIVSGTTLISIVIPEGAENVNISDSAFKDSNIEVIIIKSKTAVIDNGAFYDDVTVYGYAGSTAEDFTNNNGNAFVELTDACTEHIYYNSKYLSLPTCQKEGSYQVLCAVCGAEGAVAKAPKINHNMVCGTCIYCFIQASPQYRLEPNQSVSGLFTYDGEAVMIFKPAKGGTYTLGFDAASTDIEADAGILDSNGNITFSAEFNSTGNGSYTFTLETGEYVIAILEGGSTRYLDADSENYDDISFTMSAKCKHSYTVKTTKATQKADGKTVKTCSACGNKVTTVIPKISSVKLSATSYTYDAKAKTPAVTVNDSKGNALKKNTDYTVTYPTGRTNVGKYTVKITFKGKYSGTASKTFTIKPKATSLTSVTAASKGFTAKWSKQASQTTGYELQYSTSDKFTNATTTTIAKTSTTSKSISKLTGKKKYYVRVRTYKIVKVNGKSTKVYSSWSAAKSVTTKA